MGIIGGTGSGKSSIVNLIPRFYDVTSGEVLIDDVNVKKIELNELRKIVGDITKNTIANFHSISDTIISEPIIKNGARATFLIVIPIAVPIWSTS